MAPSRNKYFCPKCKRSFKDLIVCPVCEIEMINMGKKWRFPKHNSSKQEWKKELSKLTWNIYNEDLKKLYFSHNLPYIISERGISTEEKEKITKEKNLHHLLYVETNFEKIPFNQIVNNYCHYKFICVVKNKKILKNLLKNSNYKLLDI